MREKRLPKGSTSLMNNSSTPKSTNPCLIEYEFHRKWLSCSGEATLELHAGGADVQYTLRRTCLLSILACLIPWAYRCLYSNNWPGNPGPYEYCIPILDSVPPCGGQVPSGASAPRLGFAPFCPSVRLTAGQTKKPR